MRWWSNMIFVSHRYRDTGIYPATDLARRFTAIELSDEFCTLGIYLGYNWQCQCGHCRWIASDKVRTAWKIRPRLERRRTATLLNFGVSKGHYIIGTYTRRISLEHLLCIFPALGLKRKRHLGVYYMEDLGELSCMNIGSLNRLIGSIKWFLK